MTCAAYKKTCHKLRSRLWQGKYQFESQTYHCNINSNCVVVCSTQSDCVAERRSIGVLKFLAVGMNGFSQVAKHV